MSGGKTIYNKIKKNKKREKQEIITECEYMYVIHTTHTHTHDDGDE